jgi:hypothetical protein
MGPVSRALGILLAALLFWTPGAPGVLAKDKDQWTERLTFATGRSVAFGAGHSSAQMFDSRAARQAMFE